MEAAVQGSAEGLKRETIKEEEEMKDKVYTIEIPCPEFPIGEFKEFKMDYFNPLRDFMGVDNYLKLSEDEKQIGKEITLRVKY